MRKPHDFSCKYNLAEHSTICMYTCIAYHNFKWMKLGTFGTNNRPNATVIYDRLLSPSSSVGLSYRSIKSIILILWMISLSRGNCVLSRSSVKWRHPSTCVCGGRNGATRFFTVITREGGVCVDGEYFVIPVSIWH